MHIYRLQKETQNEWKTQQISVNLHKMSLNYNNSVHNFALNCDFIYKNLIKKSKKMQMVLVMWFPYLKTTDT